VVNRATSGVGSVEDTGGKVNKGTRPPAKWFADEANWFVLFVRTGEEKNVVRRVQRKLDADKYNVFVPTKDRRFRSGGKDTVSKVIWLSGYVFIAALVDEAELIEAISPLVFIDPKIIKVLTNGSPTDGFMLTAHDKAIMTALLDADFNIPALEAVFVGDKVKITDGVLNGLDGRVTRVNKHRRSALLEVNLFGGVIKCEVMLEILAKTDEKRGVAMSDQPEKIISYNNLWKLLIDKGMNKGDLKRVSGVSTTSIAKMAKGQNVQTDVLLKICKALDCKVEEIIETVIK
jgi:DNA-binding Xre family transcriptional regulator/transcription antitermination factor NusG